MKIAIVGTRGVPGRYGGFETLAEQLAVRLSDRGHQVTVYCRKAFTSTEDDFDLRVQRVILPGLQSKYFDTVVHTFFSVLHLIKSDVDVALICNVANSPFAWIPRCFGIATVLNVDGLDRKRRKWNLLGRSFLYVCELLALFTPSRLLTDSFFIQRYFSDRYGVDAEMIAYGAECAAPAETTVTTKLPQGKYILCVNRFEPENNIDLVLKAYRSIATDWPLVIVGGNAYDAAYERELRAMADSRVVFTGPVYGEGYWELQRNAGIFVSAAEVGGTHPSLVEAMAAGNPVLYFDNPENRETVDEGGIGFARSANDLADKLHWLIESPTARDVISRFARERAASVYSWEAITRQYERLLSEVCGQAVGRTPFEVAGQQQR